MVGKSTQTADNETIVNKSDAEEVSSLADAQHPTAPTSSEKPSGPAFLRMTGRRDTSPALAKDMASRRGIPQAQKRRTTQPSPSVSTLQAVGQMTRAIPGVLPAEEANPDERNRTSATGNRMDTNKSPAKMKPDDDSFAKFYSNLTTGPISKLSSMLTFAGLPLTDESPEESPTHSRTEKTSARAISGPDVNKLFSKAALQAIEEQQRNQGLSGNAFGPGESFYVIPASGGTASYANILSRGQHLSMIGEDAEEFVDASETPSSPRQGRTSGLPAGVREEELQIQNAALKQLLDKLSHRLQAFESHAQDASMAALTQSMASVRSTQPAGTTHDAEERIRAMEAQLEREIREREQLKQETVKQKQVIAKYRSHWEQLKDSARAKDKAKREKADSAG